MTRRQLFWGHSDKKGVKVKKMHLLNWASVCLNKEAGGLSISNLYYRNMTLLAKWWWKFHGEKNSSWMKFLSSKYGEDFIYKKNLDTKKMSLMFRDIWKCKSDSHVQNLINNWMFKWKIGDGRKVKFWKDIWNGSNPLSTSFKRLFHLFADKNISVSDMKTIWSGYNSAQW